MLTLTRRILRVGFKASKELIEHVGGLAQPATYTKTVVDAVKGLVRERLAELARRKSTEDCPEWHIALADVDQLDNLLDTTASVNDARP